jgi:hypothetical protein
MTEWIAGVPFRAKNARPWPLSKVGGTLTLTGDALAFRPLLGLGRTHRFDLTDITEATACGDRPPRLRVRTRDGRGSAYIVAPTRGTPVWSVDTSARDSALDAINGWIG